MSVKRFSHAGLALLCSLSACSARATGLIPSGAVAPQNARATSGFGVIYSFGKNGVDGEDPAANLIDVGGTFYGTTQYGGKYGVGTVFSLTPGGKERVLHSFQETSSGSDGYQPLAGLIDVDGTLYGTTFLGGKYSGGTVFTITTDGKEKVLHSFGSPSSEDGSNPGGSLIDVKGTLYGTTESANYSRAAAGTVFSITTSGKEKVVYGFNPSAGAGVRPAGALVDVNGTLYGTTETGGAHEDGTVFGVTTGGKETLTYSFDGSDGQAPVAGLLYVKGTLYGTTSQGGAHGLGTVFSTSTKGKQNWLYSFGGSSIDGKEPYAALVAVDGTLYGTTILGGGASRAEGTVFSITTSGKEKVVHNFGYGSNDASTPEASLLYVKGTLYGTTYLGGTYFHGTAFSLAVSKANASKR